MSAAYRAIEHYQIELRPQRDIVLEIGSERGEGSTRFFSDYALAHGVLFITVDVNPDVIQNAIDYEIGQPRIIGRSAVAVVARGEDFLTTFAEDLGVQDQQGIARVPNIKIAYLDNFDWWWGEPITPYADHVTFGEELYEPFGLELSNDASQAAHLAQAQLVHEYNDAGSLIIFDDTWGVDQLDRVGYWDGKGGTAVPWLLDTGCYETLEYEHGPGVVYGAFVVLRRVR